MYEEYMQNFFNYPINGCQNTYDQSNQTCQYNGAYQNMYNYRTYGCTQYEYASK